MRANSRSLGANASSLAPARFPHTRQLLARRVVLGGLLLGLGERHTARAAGLVRIGGTGSALGALRLLAAAFSAAGADAEINVLPSLGTSGGLRALQAGVIDLAVAARPLTESERAAGLRDREYARTPLVFATGPALGLHDLSSADIARIYAGEMTEWPDRTPVRLIRRPPTEADWEALRKLSPAMVHAVDLTIRRPGLVTAASDQDNADAIESVRGSFGLLTLGQMLSERRQLTPFALNGVRPEQALAALERWPLVRRLHVVTSARTPSDARAFAAFVIGPAGGAVLTGCGHVPIGDAGG
ncbi:substrate-binding domain-containing protein [Plastoroseomonas hellenica]|uniref:substrate-binding domain-containing protein n=1 Tax=Plastoroseomonas hellenica TaxID=2687306 RepID=UPI001BAB2F4B|nr:substrate-binding domain-containing protein [Plastoroseomonas hellenica]MBR0645979.1 ABC transporter substrate-binding protein [Plastoroseomonas hellenica]